MDRRHGFGDTAGHLPVREPFPFPMRNTKLQSLIPAVCEIARLAGAEIMTFYRRPIEIREKADKTPVTEADEAADRLIVERLGALTPTIRIASEESVAARGLPKIEGRSFWLVDPLDGTREFINRRDEFTVNIALIEDGVPVLGVIHAPARSELYFGTVADAAYRQSGDGPPQRIAARASPAGGMVVAVSRSHRDPALDAYLAKVMVASQVPMGSALKFCLIACGAADLYPRFGRTMEWDTAAGQAILEAAGGSVRTLEGKPFAYCKPGLINSVFIARGKEN